MQCSRDLLKRNPFAGLKSAVGSNRERDFFVTRDMATKVLEACPDSQWRVLFALSRFAGLRCPSETLALQWADVREETNPPKAAQNAAQSVRAGGCLTLQGKSHQEKKTLELQRSTTLRDPLQFQSMGDTGFEPVTSAV